MENETTWREKILSEMSYNKETLGDVVSSDPPVGPWLDEHHGWGTGRDFIVWTKNYVYFREDIEDNRGIKSMCRSVKRNPGAVTSPHDRRGAP